LGYEVAVVMPVHNEQGCIGRVLTSWRDMLLASGINFVMLVIDDGSRDGTGEILQEFARDDRIRVTLQSNMGHGPTILRGYRSAVELAEWVFQCDSDDEMPADSFRDLWEVRGQVDAVLGYRQNRKQTLQRRVISFVSRATVDLLFGKGVTDVNAPYRLLRASALRRILPFIPPDTFAPNVVLSGALVLMRMRICNVPVPHHSRQSGRVSIVRWKLWKAALQSFWQTVCCSRQIRQRNRSNGGVAPMSGHGQG
jgi:glycosyltransferase involved in cell wall biosynthesis